MNKLNIMLVGVGGQGTLLASRILGAVAVNLGFDVKVSEVHGMAQRGGSVVTYVKMREKVYSPIIEKGEADIILAFEQLEAARWLEFLSSDGTMIVNEQKINPMPVITGKARYPQGILESLKENNRKVISLDALDIARSCGNIKAVNVVMIGLLAATTEISKNVWLDALQQVIPEKFLALNFKAFEAGYTLK